MEGGRLQAPFEHPERAEIIRAALAADGGFEFVAPDDWGLAPITAIHDTGLVNFLEVAWAEYQKKHGPTHDVVPDVFAMPALREGMGERGEPTDIGMRLGWWGFETTTPITKGTYDAARASVDVALTATDLVLAGEEAVYGLCRPPGHHAARAAYGGYCFFNNAAIAANHLAAATSGKVAVLDVDFHHGNGTQQIFYDRSDVEFVSLHGDPESTYPYVTGFDDEIGVGRGRGATVNYPLPEGIDDDAYLDALSAACAHIAACGADALVVSLGLDTYFDDPISTFGLTPDGLARCGAMVRELNLPLVVLQEGGYATDELGENARRWLNGI